MARTRRRPKDGRRCGEGPTGRIRRYRQEVCGSDELSRKFGSPNDDDGLPAGATGALFWSGFTGIRSNRLPVDDMTVTDRTVRLMLSTSDRDLIRHHGYPFPGIRAALEAVPESEDPAEVACEAFEVELLLGDLARSMNDCADRALMGSLNDLYEYIESEAGI